MTAKSCYGLLLGLLLVICVLLAGCSSQSSTTTIAKITTQPQPKYTAGNIITNNASSAFWLITSYDSTNDLYQRVLVQKNSDGSWSQVTGQTESDTWNDVEKLYPVLLTQVSVASVTYATPTVPTTVTTTLSGSGPIVSAVSPTTGAIGTTLSVTITGSNFQNGATVRLVQAGLQPVSASSVSVSSTQITGTFNLASLNAGPANIEVINPDGRAASLSSAITIGEPSPTISNINPTSGALGSSYTLTLTGQQFTDVSAVTLWSSDASSQIQCSSPSSAATTVSCTLAIPGSVNAGSYSVEALTSDGTMGWLNSSFTVNNSTS
jgi:uncharacterized protein YceK